MLNYAKFVLSKKELIKQYDLIKSVCDVVSYSSKTNYEVGGVLEKFTDCFFSIHSISSLSKVKDKKRVWFIAQAWNEEELEILFNEGVENFIVDNQADLDMFLNYLTPNSKPQTPNLLLRMRMKENTIRTGKYFVHGFFSEQVNKLISELRKNELINNLGLHFHRKTQNISEWSLVEELKEILSEETIKSISILNIGGGFPIKYKNYQGHTIDYIFGEIIKLKQWANENNIYLITEPGRFLAGPPVKLVCKIKTVYDNNIIVNASVYNSAMDTFVSGLRLEVEEELKNGNAYTIKGMTPCSMDIFRYRVYLNTSKVGDKIVFINAGAYNFASDFCSLPKLITEIVD